MNRYGPRAKDIIKRTMQQYREGELFNGKTGQLVKNHKQALAIGLSIAREKSYKLQDEN